MIHNMTTTTSTTTYYRNVSNAIKEERSSIMYLSLVLVACRIIRAGNFDFADIAVDDILAVAHGLDEEQPEALVDHDGVIQLGTPFPSSVCSVKHSHLK